MDLKDITKKIKLHFNIPMALVAGAMVTYALAPYSMALLGLLSPAILLWCLANQPPKKAFWIGLGYGIGLFGRGVSWIYVSVHDFGAASPALAGLITASLVLFLSLYPALMCWILNKYFDKKITVKALLAFPTIWVLFEMIRGWFLTGFPWLYLGYTQMHTALKGFAPVGGVFLVSGFTVFVGALIYLILNYYYQQPDKPQYRNGLIFAFCLAWGTGFALKQIVWTYPTDKQLNVALVQGNVAQLMRWDPIYVRNIIDTYRNLSAPLHSDVIIWPESAIPVPWPLSQSLFKEMNATVQGHSQALISGVPVEAKNGKQYYNALLTVGVTDGKTECLSSLQPGCVYFKSHLVPFGEYVPLEAVLRGLIQFFDLPMSSFISGPSDQAPLVAQDMRFAPAICYEITYPEFVRRMSNKADFILTVSNDTWFGTSIGPIQHLQIAQFRAIETGKYVIRATNTGYTAIINPEGAITAQAQPFTTTVLEGKVSQMAGQTLWSRIGVWPIFALVVAGLGAAWVLDRRKKAL